LRLDSAGVAAMNDGAIMLLGRRDRPTDAVEDYCEYLGQALRSRDFDAKIVRVAWAERGWNAALHELRRSAGAWRGRPVCAQYTALAWSIRGFPLRFLRVVKIVREAGARLAVVFHDVEPYGGDRLVDNLRRRAQLHTMQRALHYADPAIFTVALDVVSWLDKPPRNARFIPVGANLPVAQRWGEEAQKPARRSGKPLCVTVFGITGGTAGKQECRRIAEAMKFAVQQTGRVRLHAFGRAVEEFDSQLRSELRDAPVEVQVEGVLPAKKVVEALASADAMLFVRAPVSSRRGSAIAGIACGLPVIAYRGADTAAPITDAGVVLVGRENPAELGQALARVLMDDEYRKTLAERSRVAQAGHFSWEAIASQYLEALGGRSSPA
jgi:glycosyltransferase involved in cell wall biosynthesis